MSEAQIYCTLSECANASLVTLTATDSSPEFEELIENWICSVRRVGIAPLLWAFDQSTHTKLLGRGDGVRSILSADVQLFTQDLLNSYKRPPSRQYTSAVALKPRVIWRVLTLGFNVLFLDVDVALHQDPRPWLLKHGKTTAPHLQISLNLGNPEALGKQAIDVNSGVVYLRTDPGSLAMVELWSNRTARRFKCASWGCGDQEQLTRILKECGWRHIEQSQLLQHGGASGPLPNPRLVTDMTDNMQQKLGCHHLKGQHLRVDALPPRYFSSGSTASIALWRRPNGLSGPSDLISLHPTHLGTNSYVKEKLLRSLRPLNRPLWCANTSLH